MKTLYYTQTRVKRSVISLDTQTHQIVYSIKKIPLCRCSNCKHHYRVLPCDILPRKIYSLSVISLYCVKYLTNDSETYRFAALAFQTVKIEPVHFSSIHGWLGGIGKMAKDLPMLPTLQVLSTTSLIQKTKDFLGVFKNIVLSIYIHPKKYRSDETSKMEHGQEKNRKKELTDAAEFFKLASLFFPKTKKGKITGFSLTKWYGFLITKMHDSYIWIFPSRYKICKVRPFNTS